MTADTEIGGRRGEGARLPRDALRVRQPRRAARSARRRDVFDVPARRTRRTSRSASASTCASARRWRAWRPASCSKRCSPASPTTSSPANREWVASSLVRGMRHACPLVWTRSGAAEPDDVRRRWSLSRADDDTDGLCLRGSSVVVARGRRTSARGARRARSCGIARPRAVPRRRAARQRARVRLPAGRRRAGGRRRRRHQPDPPGRRARPRHPPHRLRSSIVTDDLACARCSTASDLGARRPTASSTSTTRTTRRGSRPAAVATRGRLDAAPAAGPRDAVRPDLHVGLDRRAEGRADDPGPRRARRRATLLFAPDDVLYCRDAAVPRQRADANLVPALRSGATIALRRRFSASAFLPDVQRYGVTFFNTVGRALDAHPRDAADPRRPRSPRSSSCSGPSRRPPTSRAFRERFGIPVIEGYGSSENAIIMMPDAATLPPGSLGRPLDGIDVVVLDPVDRRRGEPRAASTSTAGC